MIDTLPDIGVNPDWGLGESPEMKVKTVTFGDGYEQRSPDGINSVRRSWSPKWGSLEKQDKDTLYNFLLSKKGVEAFMWPIPEEGETVRVVCKDVKWTHDDFNNYVVTAEFKEDFSL